MKKITGLINLFLILGFCQTYGQSLRGKIDSVYNFIPHTLSHDEQEQTSMALDRFWDEIKSDTTQFTPKLRQELRVNNHYPFFYYDGSTLLLSLSKSRSDKELAVAAISKCDIKDINPKEYVILLDQLATDSINTTNAAVKVLQDSVFSFFIPQHAMTFNQGYCLMYCLLPLKPDLYVDKLITVFKQTKDVQAQKAILTTLWFSYSCSGDKFLQSLNEANTLTKEVADYAAQLLSDNELDKEYMKMLKKIKPGELEEMRKSALTRFSDEAIDDLDFVTKANRKNNSCR